MDYTNEIKKKIEIYELSKLLLHVQYRPITTTVFRTFFERSNNYFF